MYELLGSNPYGLKLKFEKYIQTNLPIMHKGIITFFLFFFLIFGLSAQEYLIEGKSATIVYQVPDRTKEQLFNDALVWFQDEERTSQYTVESSDLAAGTIAVNEVNQVFYKNIGKLMYPQRSGMAEMLSGDFSYHIDLVFEEGTYMVKYELTGMAKEMYGRDQLFYECIDFEEIDKDALKAYNKSMDKLLKMNVVLKKRRQIFEENSLSQFEDASQNVLNSMTANMGSLYSYLKLGE
jgi:hypothetical protein